MLFLFLCLIALAWLIQWWPIGKGIAKPQRDESSAESLPPSPSMDTSYELTAEEALQSRPTDLGSLEPELASATPRPERWCSEHGEPYCHELFKIGRAVRGWVCRMIEIPDYEGPDYHIWYAYEIDGKVRTQKIFFGVDILHWAMGEPDSYAWFKRSFIVGNAITVLVDPNDADKSVVYGLRGPYIAESDPATGSQVRARWAAH